MNARKTQPADNKKKERGQALILFTLSLAILMGFMAMTIDVGIAYVNRRDMQNAADAAVLAAADSLLEGATPAQAAAVAAEWAEKNGYLDDGATISVSVNIPPASGPYQGNPDYVEVLIEREVDTIFARVLGKNTWDISGRAVAGILGVPKPYSLIALNPQVCDAMNFDGNVTVTIDGGGTFTNSSCPTSAFSAEGNVTVDDSVNDVVGGWNITGSSTVEPEPTKAGHIEDPLKDVPVPTPPAGPVQACPTFSGPPGTRTLQPGVYNCKIDPPGNWGLRFEPGDYHITGGLVINGSGSVTFGAGIYTLGGVGLKLTGNGTVVAEEVMFYIDEGAADLSGTGQMTITAPQDGAYAGIAIFQNRELTSTVKLRGTSLSNGWGTVYAAAAEADIAGTADTSLQFIADTIWVHGTSTINIKFNNFEAGAPTMKLVE